MSNDNVIKLRSEDWSALQESINAPGPPTEALRELMTTEQVAMMEGQVMDVSAEALGFKDMESAFNMRDWLQKACEAKGAKMVGGGFGFGQADIDIELDGCRFNISIRPQ